MTACDVLVVGGGPAGSTAAAHLARRGVDVAVLDRAAFPRDKVCAGWITPAVVEALALDLDDYARGRTLQPFCGFAAGPLDGRVRHVAAYGRAVSYGIRRCEFDAYLLARSGARVLAPAALTSLRRDGADWIANDAIRARVVVGAGGHFCPVAAQINPRTGREDVVVAQEIEVRVEDPAVLGGVAQDLPELFFWRDLLGYGWCVRKGEYVNVGAGRLTATAFPAAMAAFTAAMRARGIAIPDGTRWKGHAYLLNRTRTRRVAGEGVVLVGDAAGLALAPSGEGILAAVESGAMAAAAIVSAFARRTPGQLDDYAAAIDARFGPPADRRRSMAWPSWMGQAAARAILSSRWLTRRLLIEEGFLHMRRAAWRPAA